MEHHTIAATGPRTGAGKAISSRNALKHGLSAMKPANAVDAGLRSQYESLRRQYLDEFQPQGAIENTLIDLVILAAWQLYKIRALETFAEIDLGDSGSAGASLRLARYRGANERLLFRSLSQLRHIQQQRALLAVGGTRAIPGRLAPGVCLQPILARLDSLTRPRVMTAGAGSAGLKRPGLASPLPQTPTSA